MKFCKDRAFSSLNADKLKAGDKVIVADTMQGLKYKVKANEGIDTLYGITDEGEEKRFLIRIDCINKASAATSWLLAYLVERKANCTNCGIKSECKDADIENPELHNCLMWEKPKTEQKAEDKWCKNCGVEACSRAGVDADVRCPAWQPRAEKKCGECIHRGECITSPNGCDKFVQEPSEKYRPFKDTDELIKVWCEKKGEDYTGYVAGVYHDMPNIWVRRKGDPKDKGRLITAFNDDCVEIGEAGSGDVLTMDGMFEIFSFLDGSPCGVEE